MKKLLVIVCCLLSVYLSEAQVKFGLRGGLSTMNVDPGELLITNTSDAKSLKIALSEANYGVHFGLFTQIKMGRFFLQPEVLFNSNSVDFAIEDFTQTDVIDDIRKESYQYLDIPVMMGLKYGPLRLQGGPVGHLFLNSKSELFDLAGYEQKFDEMTYGWQAGIGLDIGKVILDIKYEGTFKNFGDHIVFDDQAYAFDSKPGRFVASLGIAF